MRWTIAVIFAAVMLVGGLAWLWRSSADGAALDAPRASAEAFYAGLASGNPRNARFTVVQEDVQLELARAMAELVQSGVEPSAIGPLPAADPQSIQSATLQTTNETATLVLPDGGSIVLIRDGDLWRVDLLATTGLSEREAAQLISRLREAARPAPVMGGDE